MLVLTRKKDQALIISDNIEITVLDIQGDQIRIGIEAPKSVKIFRKEIYLEIQEENRNAAKRTIRAPAENLRSMLNLPGPEPEPKHEPSPKSEPEPEPEPSPKSEPDSKKSTK